MAHPLMQLKLDRYEIGPLLGSGAMADVFEAYDHRLHRRVALKLLKVEGLDATARARFSREALAGARLTHPNAAAVYDYAEDAQPPFLVMELVEGTTLAEHLRQQGAVPVDEAIQTTDQILAALAAAHELGILHRDVKPANVMLAEGGTVKLVDFGIAKSRDTIVGALHDATVTGLVVGTPRYLAPELLAGASATPSSDLYSVGLVLYEMLAGAAAYDAGTPPAAHHRAAICDLAERRAGLPASVTAVVERAIADDPAQRFPDAVSMRAALDDVSVGDPTVALDAVDATRTAIAPVLVPSQRSSSQPERSRRARGSRGSGRRRAAWMAAAGIVGLLVVGGAVLALGGEDDPATQAVASEPSAVPTTVATTTTTVPLRPTTLGLEAANVPALLSLLAGRPDEFGSATDELSEDLQRLLVHPDKHGKDVDRLRERLDAWVEDGELDPRLAVLVASVLDQTSTFEIDRGPKDDRD